ncbi:MAG: hypothetical protein GY745_08000 [Actinomycetia bacterium]|nr:hypothetical protein [Actinomycetes bacterium]MCP4084979.1 hypothetical protein [Actinomycetes bacterium]
MAERVRLRIGSVANAVLVTGQAYQDPKDALNEFVSNAADEYAETGRAGRRIRVVLKRRGRYPTIAIDDSGRGMDPDRLREVARNLFKSVKVGNDRTLGEKAIGLLAFQQLGGRMDIVSRAKGSNETWCLGLERGSASARLELEKRRARTEPGTTVYLRDIDREVLRMLTQRKVVDYLRRRRADALDRGLYEIEVVEGKASELVTPEAPDGVKVPLRAHHTLWGPIEFSLHVAPPDGTRRAVSVVGRAGTTIIDDVSELEELALLPWTSGQVSGRIGFAALAQSAGRRAILRDDEAFPVFLDAVRSIAPTVQSLVERVREEIDRETTDRVSDQIRRIFASVLRELDDIDNPMRTPTGGNGDGSGDGGSPESGEQPEREPPTLDDLADPPDPKDPPPPRPGSGDGTSKRSSRLPSVAPDPHPGEHRSRFDSEERVVFYNETHADYLMVKGSEPELLDYLATLVAKEYVVYNNPIIAPDDLAEEMVRMLIRVRRHLTKPRR